MDKDQKRMQITKSKASKLKDYASNEMIKKCSNCSMCRDICPTYLVQRKESSFAGGKMRILRTFAKENLSIDKDFAKVMAFCTTCKHCEIVCPIDFNFTEVIEELRATLVRENNCFEESDLKFSKNVFLYKNPYGEDPQKRMDWLPRDFHLNPTSPYAYFVGCTASYRETESAKSTAIILSRLIEEGIQILGGDEYCCGSPLIRTGQVDFDLSINNKNVNFQIGEYIHSNIEKLKSRGIKTVIFNCSGCYKTAVQEWARYYGEKLPFHTIHLVEFLFTKIEFLKKYLKPLKKTVIYHDPCHIGRYIGLYNEPREIIKAIPEIKFVEFENIKEKTLCCGAGGGLKTNFSSESVNIAKIKIEEALRMESDLLLTACVFCKRNFKQAIEQLNSNIKIQNLEDLICSLLS